MDPITMRLYVDDHIRQALREDITFEDVSTASVCPEPHAAEVQLIAKAPGVIAGLDVFERTFTLLDPHAQMERFVRDGDEAEPGQLLAYVRADARTLLSGERTALNYLQRMSGIATYTRAMAHSLEGTKTVLVDTRKTTPGMRIFEKEAVALGGGRNHRFNLSTAVMLKDNHIDAAGSIERAVQKLRAAYTPCPPIEVECRTLDHVREAVAARADRIMMDNMRPPLLGEALALVPAHIETEVSGGVTLENIGELARCSRRAPDFISVGRLTHSAVAADFSMTLQQGRTSGSALP